MRTFGLDVETTKLPFIHPWQDKAFLVSVGLADETGWRKTWTFNHKDDYLFSVETREGSKVKKLKRYSSQREMIDEIQAIILTANRLVGHNLKFDLNWLRALGISFGHCKLWCTLVTEYLLRSQRIGNLQLSDLSEQYLSVRKIDRVKTFWDAGYETDEIPLRILLPYLEQDCINALAIYQRQVPKIQAEGMVSLAAVVNGIGHVLSEIETNGMLLDKEEAWKHITALQLELQVLDTYLKEAVYELVPEGHEIDFSSRDNLSAYLYGGEVKVYHEEWVMKTLKSKPETIYKPVLIEEKVKIKGFGFEANDKLKTKKKGVFQTGKDTIKYLKAKTKKQKEVKKHLVKRSGVFKALSSLYGKTDDAGIYNKVGLDGLVHPQYNQTIAITGRLTSSDPNGQNLPREGTSPIKQSFIARFDYILGVDLSQIEWRIVAWLSQDETMIAEILAGVDPHTENAVKFFGAGRDMDNKKNSELRTVAKIMTFRLIYGGSAYSFYMDSKMPNYSLKKWEWIVNQFYQKYKGLARWQAANIRKVFSNGGWIKNPTGRKFVFDKGPKGYRPQQIKNYPVQSLATADIMPVAMLAIYNRFKKEGYESLFIGQVHDSLIFDVKKHEMEAIASMCIEEFEKLPEYINQLWPDMKFDMPLTGDAEYGKSWGDMTKLKLAA